MNERISPLTGNSLILIIKVYMFKVFRLIMTWVVAAAKDIICSNDERSLFPLLSGPELCGNHYVEGNQNEGALFKPKPSRSHLLIKFTEVAAVEKHSCRFGNVNEDRAILPGCHQSKTLSLWGLGR